MIDGPKAIAARRWIKRTAIQSALEVVAMAHRTGLGSRNRGLGAIFTLHHVRPYESRAFDPAAHLAITPDFLEAVIISLKAAGHIPTALADLPHQLVDEQQSPPTMVFTLDDGYRDNLEHALPIFERHNVPFTVFVTGGFVDRTHSIWWKTAEALLSKLDSFTFDFGSGLITLPTRTLDQKYAAYDRLYRAISCREQHHVVDRLDALARENGIDPLAIVDREVMNEADLKALLQSPLATLGAHTISHCSMAHVTVEDLQKEIEQSALRVAAICGERPLAFAYPYGDRCAAGQREYDAVRDSGFDLAVTTEPDVLHKEAACAIHALNRISLNGYYQKPRYVEALASGLPFAARNLLYG